MIFLIQEMSGDFGFLLVMKEGRSPLLLIHTPRFKEIYSVGVGDICVVWRV